MHPDLRYKWRNLTLLAVAELLAMAMWFSASAVVPQLTAEWSLDSAQQAWLTMSVQAGFVVGALISAVSFELVEEGGNVGGAGWLAIGLGLGALVYYFANLAIERGSSGSGQAASSALADSVPSPSGPTISRRKQKRQ